jgi:FimV-like protein
MESVQVPTSEPEPDPLQVPASEPEPAPEPEPVAVTSQLDSPLLEPGSATPLLSLVAAEITTAAAQTLTTVVSQQETSVRIVTDSEASPQEVAATEVLPPVESPVTESVAEPSSDSPMPESTEEPPSQPPVEELPSELPAPEADEEPSPVEPSTDAAQQAPDKPLVAEPVQSTPTRYKGGDEYGPVSNNERLWNIAGKVVPDPSIDRDVMMKALFMANPQAFSKSSMDYLKEGAMLRIPTLREIVEYTGSSAAQQLLEKRENATEKSIDHSF